MLIKPNGEGKGRWREWWTRVDGREIPPDALQGQIGGAGLYIARELEKRGAPIRVTSRRMYGIDHEWAEYLGPVEMNTVKRFNRVDRRVEDWLQFRWVDQGL